MQKLKLIQNRIIALKHEKDLIRRIWRELEEELFYLEKQTKRYKQV